MTLVECFDQRVMQNVVGCLRLRPEKVIFLGQQSQMQGPLTRLQGFFDARGMDIQVQPCPVDLQDLPGISAMLQELLRQEQECVIDIAGGDERIVMAVGAALALLSEEARKGISLQRFDPDDDAIAAEPLKFTVQELIALHGGIVYPASQQPEEHWTPRDLEPLWRIASSDPSRWNRMLSILAEFESWADSLQQVFLMLRYVQGRMSGFPEKKEKMLELLRELREGGIITDLSRGDILEYTYTTELNRLCTTKAGNVLEVKALLEARRVEQGGRPLFDDCMMGVQIDWDGVIHAPEERIPETHNEIDLILLHGTTPLFVSCKNGDVDESELYKLHTVATRFGGENARKMLIVSNLEKKNPTSARALRQRTVDMGIYLVTNAAKLSSERWQEVFREALR